MLKFVITLLSSSNEKLLKLCYNSVINQINHNLNYTIVIIINTTNKLYYKNVIEEFKDIDVKIIETESNGKPGKGHNSCLNYFNNNIEYDYLIMLDGDDFIYPSFLSQISKALLYNNKLDILALYGNDSLRTKNESDISDIYIANNFYLRTGYFLPKKFHDSKWLVNPFIYNIRKNGIITILRILLYSRNFINKNNNIEFYSEKCYILDDYIAYLNYIDNIINKNMNGLIINSDGIYLYNNLNNNSVSIKYSEKFNSDYETILSYKKNFENLNKILGEKWDLSKLEYKQLSLPYNNEILNITENNDGSYSINKDDILTKTNYINITNFATLIINNYYDLSLEYIDNMLFNNIKKCNIDNLLEICNLFINNDIFDRKLFIYTSILYFYKNDKENSKKYYELSDYYKDKYPILKEYNSN